MNRRDFLIGNGAGLCVGAAGGSFGTWEAFGAPPASAKLSYAQTGEDLILKQALLDILKLEKPDYIDIGAWDPVEGSNTYLFYRGGSRGVLVEPNPAMCKKLRAGRKGDTVVNAGIAGAGGPTEADYYITDGDGELNTFDAKQVEKIKQKYPNAIKEVRKMPLLNVNAVLSEHFQTAPALLSIDTEGMDLSILQTLDFARWRPKVFCVESGLDNGLVNEDIVGLMTSKNYLLRAGNFVNSVFVDRKLVG